MEANREAYEVSKETGEDRREEEQLDPAGPDASEKAEAPAAEAEPVAGPPDSEGGNGAAAAPPADAETEAEAAEPTLEEQVQSLLREKEEQEDRYLRLLADFENFKKRARKERADQIQFGNEGLLRDFLPIVDNLERVLGFDVEEGQWKGFQEGIQLVLSEIHKTLANYGVQPIEARGQAFDPNLHEAMQRLETDEHPTDTVVDEFQKGYLYRGRLLRPSRVVVAKTPEAPQPVEGDADVVEGEEAPEAEGGGRDEPDIN